MMRERWLFHLGMCAALTWAAACGAARPQTGEGGSQGSVAESIEDSGRHLNGDYAVQALSDEYPANSVQAPPRWTFSFKDEGAYRSEREAGGTTRVETGSYLISTQGALVLYVEAVGGNALGDARIEPYQIEAQSEGELRLRRDGSTRLVLRKK